jgi:hypothetical protein
MGYVVTPYTWNAANSPDRYISYAALAVSVPVVLLTLVLPDKRLGYVLSARITLVQTDWLQVKDIILYRNLNWHIFRCLMRTVYVTLPDEVIDVQSVFALAIVVLQHAK